MFRLAPRASSLNNLVYGMEEDFPHLVKTQRFIDVLDERSEREIGDRTVPVPVNSIEFDDVTFAYENEEAVLEDLSFSAERGEFVAFVGTSGGGKSTIISLLTQLRKPDQGRILADDTSISAFDIDDWRRRISVVRQDPHIFNETLLYNVAIGNREASREEIEEVCEVAQITEFLDDMSDSFEAELGDDGVRLSGGQRQRVAIARALLKDADVLVLDEATSDLDTNIEAEVQRAIESMDREYALLVIAHRLSTVINAHEINVVDDGEIVERGTHAELLAEGEQYASLYASQSDSVSDLVSDEVLNG